jgi:hypothetical protein
MKASILYERIFNPTDRTEQLAILNAEVGGNVSICKVFP